MADDSDPSIVGAFRDIVLGAQSTIGGIVGTVADDTASVFEGGQDTISSVLGNATDTAGNVALGAQSTIQTVALGAQDTIQQVASPLNLFGLGAGLGAGGLLVTSAFVVGGAAVADEVFAGGAGRMALFALFKGRRRR